MKKFGLLLAGGIAALVLLTNLGPMIGLAISVAILYVVFKQFLKEDSMLGKVGWGILGGIVLMGTASNIPAIIGIAAAYILYLVYKKWNDSKTVTFEEKFEENDPFTNFEKQWTELNKKEYI
ncbi:lia operon protein LiaI [Cytobacillus eiseniae]|uniref:Lia operon protein LiaI n=1 Tax=Cytobacillus eiseniae TaxID=762947 RepID=A0ABS4RG88_9BACI|nr:flagellar basal body rod protein [Cytobacillus eiseniae]MBP2241915.1 lia operon protein LiaI [Cytobacillus eiseniae]